MPSFSMSRLARITKRRLRNLGLSARNAATAFHPHHGGYGLVVSEAAGFQVAHRGGTADDSVIEETFERDPFFAKVPEYAPTSTDVILDVGAHIGTFALVCSRLAPEGRVHAIEASRETFDFLRINAALNGATNLIPHHLALADRDGTTSLYHDAGNWGHSITQSVSSRSEEVTVRTMESFLDGNAVPACDLAKFNCEGAEFGIIMSSRPEILRRIRHFLILYHTDLERRWGLDDLLSHLGRAGFRAEVRGRRGVRGTVVATRDD
jgi:FkbM family methyltransferase